MWICINNLVISLINNGMFSGENLGLVLAMGFVFGGTAQMIAGMFEYKKVILSVLLHLPAMVPFGGVLPYSKYFSHKVSHHLL